MKQIRVFLPAACLLLSLASCSPYSSSYPYGGSRDEHGFDSRVGPHNNSRSRYYDGNGEGARHSHMEAEKEHLRREEEDEARRHGGYRY